MITISATVSVSIVAGLKEALERTVQVGGEMARDQAESNVLNATNLYAPLSPAYRRYKLRVGLDPRTLIATGGLLRSIQRNSKRLDPSTYQVEAIGPGADYLDEGTARMVARPYMSSVVTESGPKILERMTEELVKFI
jgi:hypothetical protein